MQYIMSTSCHSMAQVIKTIVEFSKDIYYTCVLWNFLIQIFYFIYSMMHYCKGGYLCRGGIYTNNYAVT